jgi:DNA replication licensing factor MCM5
MNLRIGIELLIRAQLQQNMISKQYFLEVDMAHLITFDEDLANDLKNSPKELLPLV